MRLTNKANKLGYRKRTSSKYGTMVHVSKTISTFLGITTEYKGRTFVGSIRQQFTGARRNNQISNLH